MKESRPQYTTRGTAKVQPLAHWHDALPDSDRATVAAAIAIMDRTFSRNGWGGDCLGNPDASRDYLRLRMSGLEMEIFAAVFLDAQNRVISYEELFRGSLTQTSVFPREVVKRALEVNAAAIVFAHNHPSGAAEPSRADEVLTQTLKHTLSMVDVKVLDHFIIGHDAAMSFAERGLL